MKIQNILGSILGSIVALLALWFKAKNAGKIEEISKQNERVIDDVKKDKKARTKSANLNVDAQLDSLRKDSSNK